MPVEEMPVPMLYDDYAMGANFWMANAWMSALFIILVVWSLVWKGMALWRAARNGHTAWYVVLLILNTAGILEILYFFIWGKPKGSKPSEPTPPPAQ